MAAPPVSDRAAELEGGHWRERAIVWRERAMAAELVAKMLQRNLDDLRANLDDLRLKVESAEAKRAELAARGDPVATLRARHVRQVHRLTAMGKKSKASAAVTQAAARGADGH